MSEDPDERKLSISTTQVMASALAAMSVAFLTSWLGTAGTIIGAFIGSVIATVGTALYSWSLNRTSRVVKQTAAQVRQTALKTGTLPRTVAQGPLREPGDDQGPGESTETTPDTTGDQTGDQNGAENGDWNGYESLYKPSSLTPAEQAAEEAELDPDAPTSRWAGFPWKKTALATGAVLLLCLLGITVVEVVTGRSMASLSGHGDPNGTTVGNVVNNDDDTKQDDSPAPPSDEQTSTPTPSQDSDGDSTEEPAPTQEPSPTSEPSDSATPNDQTNPSEGASEAP